MGRMNEPRRLAPGMWRRCVGSGLLAGWLCASATASVTFFVHPDGNLATADPTRDLAFQTALTGPMTEFDFAQFGHEYVMEPSNLLAGPVRVRPIVVDASGNPVADLGVNGNRLVETYPNVPDVAGIVEGGAGAGGAALLNRTFDGVPDPIDPIGAGIEFTFSEPVEGFGTWILDDIVEDSQYVLQVTEVGGATYTSSPMDGGNGVNLAVDGFIAVVSNVGITKVVVQQQTLSGSPSNVDFFYLDHVQVGDRFPPEICNNGVDDNADGAIDCGDSECATDPTCPEICTDGVDNNGDGLVDCDDPDCQNNPAHPNCGETLCADGVDNDGDGGSDCADADCFGETGCTVEALCADGLDNDGDGLTDCADIDCTDDAACPENCTDGIDNDGDGRIDCNDRECSTAPNCPEICGDGLDNNADDLVDCLDPICSAQPGCEDAPTFFLSPDGNLATANPDGDLTFQAALTAALTEFDFIQYGHGYIMEPSDLFAGQIRVRPNLLDVNGNNLVDLNVNGNRLVETYPGVPDIAGIIEGGTGIPPDGPGTALLNRTFDGVPDPVDPTAAATEFTFSLPVEGFGLWILDDVLEASRFVLTVTDVNGAVHVSLPLESGNGTNLAVEGFIGAVSPVGITKAVLTQQTLSGVPSASDYYYLDHIQVAGPICGNPFADADRDGDVDMDDFGAFQRCYTGTGGTASGACICFAREDTDVDDVDLSVFLNCATRAGVKAAPACDG